MKKILFAVVVGALFLSLTSQPVYARKPRPTPTPTRILSPTVTPTPTPRPPTPTPTPTAIPRADISVTVSAPAQVASNAPIQYDITVTNLGPNPATDVQFCSKLSLPGFALIGLDSGAWNLVIGGASGRYSDCNMWGSIPFLMASSSAALSFTIAEQGPQTIVNMVRASALEPDFNITNNTSTSSTEVLQW